MKTADRIEVARLESVQKAVDKIRETAGLPTYNLISECRTETRLTIERAAAGFPELSMAAQVLMVEMGLAFERVRWNSRMRTTMGRCRYSSAEIHLNPRLWLRAGWEERRDTIRHEVAHLLARKLDRRAGHGKLWKRVAVACGARPERCHGVHTRDLEVKRKRLPMARARCGCRGWIIGSGRASRIRKGTAKYRCRGCGSELRLTGEVVHGIR